jgi:CubicO group peptidase (beta-lactamase class C family)
MGCSPSERQFIWQTAPPQDEGMSSKALETLKDRLVGRNTKGLLVIRNDRIVYEWYADGYGPSRKHFIASMAKGIVGGLTVGIALTDGRLALDDPAARYIPQWNGDIRKSKLTLRQLGSHTSGLEDAEADGLLHGELTGWKGDFWKRLDIPNDPFSISRDTTRMVFPPGEKFQYSSPGIAMLTYAVTASLKDSPHKDVRTLLENRIMRPIGVPDRDWSVGYGKTYMLDDLPLVPSWGGGTYTARAIARVGRLMLRSGNWQGEQLLSAEAVRQITTDAGTPGFGAIGWWSNNGGQYPRIPRDAFWASGAGHQVVLVVPSLKLIAVRYGKPLDPVVEHHDALYRHFFTPLLDAITPPKVGNGDPSRAARSPRVGAGLGGDLCGSASCYDITSSTAAG